MPNDATRTWPGVAVSKWRTLTSGVLSMSCSALGASKREAWAEICAASVNAVNSWGSAEQDRI